jgi:hypothetical protein
MMKLAAENLLNACQQALKRVLSERPKPQVLAVTHALVNPCDLDKLKASVIVAYNKIGTFDYTTDHWLLNNVIELNYGPTIKISLIYFDLCQILDYPKTEARLCARFLELCRESSCDVDLNAINFWRAMADEAPLVEEVVTEEAEDDEEVVEAPPKKMVISNQEDLDYYNMSSRIRSQLKSNNANIVELLKAEIEDDDIPFGVTIGPNSPFARDITKAKDEIVPILEGAEVFSDLVGMF